MADEPKLDATFFAFKKRDPRFVMTRAAAGYLLIYVLVCAIYIALTWNSLGAVFAWYGGLVGTAMQGGEMTPPPPEVLGLIPFAFGVGILSIILFAAFEAACLRWLVRGEHGDGVLGLTFGADTWRVLGVYVLWFALFIAFFVVIALFYTLTTVLANVGGPAQIIALLLGALAPLGFIALLIWAAVRFAPAAATSVARRRFAFFEAPRVTKGYFWPLLGAFIILWIGYCVIAIVGNQIITLPAQALMAPVMVKAMSGDTGGIGPAMIEVMTSPVYLASMGVNFVFSTILGTVFYVAMFGVNARVVLAADATQPGATPT